jgi:hypothetical protein
MLLISLGQLISRARVCVCVCVGIGRTHCASDVISSILRGDDCTSHQVHSVQEWYNAEQPLGVV